MGCHPHFVLTCKDLDRDLSFEVLFFLSLILGKFAGKLHCPLFNVHYFSYVSDFVATTQNPQFLLLGVKAM